MTVAVGALQLMINRGEREDWFASTEIVVEAAIAVTGFYMFIVHAAFARQPFLNLALFKDRNYVAGLLFVVLSGPTQFATVLMMPLMVQTLHAYSVLLAGFIMAPRGIGTIVSMAIAGWLTQRVDTRVLMVFGFAVLVLSNAAVALFGPVVGFRDIVIASFGQGIGMGFTMVPLSLIAYSTLSPALRPEGTALFNLARGLSGAMSVALVVAILTRTAQITRSTLVEYINPARELLHGANFPRSGPSTRCAASPRSTARSRIRPAGRLPEQLPGDGGRAGGGPRPDAAARQAEDGVTKGARRGKIEADQGQEGGHAPDQLDHLDPCPHRAADQLRGPSHRHQADRPGPLHAALRQAPDRQRRAYAPGACGNRPGALPGRLCAAARYTRTRPSCPRLRARGTSSA